MSPEHANTLGFDLTGATLEIFADGAQPVVGASPSPVPAPVTLALLGAGLLGLRFGARRQRG